MNAKSIQGTTAGQIGDELEKCQTDGFRPTLAIVFLSATDELTNVLKLLDTNQITVFGASTSGQFTEQEIIENGIAILLLDINTAHFRIAIEGLEEQSTLEAAKQIGNIGVDSFSNPGFIVSGVDLATPGEFIIDGISDVAGIHTTIIGGMGGEAVFFKGKIFTNGKTYDSGIISLILDQSKIDLKGVAVSGWKPVGTEKTVTSCQDSWIKTIDHKPALAVLRKYIGDELMMDETAGSENIIRLNTTFPMQVNRKNGYSVMRPTLLANLEEQSIFCGGIVEEGNVFRFSLPPDFDVIDKVIESSEKIKSIEMPEADAMLVFSCAGRFESLGPMINQELKGLANTWEKSMAGFFCLGEFGKAEGGDKAEFHGTTCSWVALKEKYETTEDTSQK